MLAVRKQTRILSGGKVIVQDDALPDGVQVEVIVLINEAMDTPQADETHSLADLLGSGRGGFQSAAEIDSFLRSLRDEWD